MDIVLTGIELAGGALLSLALNPFYYIGLLLVALLYRRQTLLERKLFYVRLHGMAGEFLRALFWSWIGGLVVSAASAGIGLILTFDALLWIWGVTLVLLLARIRYACIAYAAGIIGLLQLAVEPFPQLREAAGLERITASLLDIHLPSLFALVALLHAIEALLLRLHGARSATPLYVEGKRGKVVGAYQLQGFWAMPLFLVVPATAGSGMESLPWPLFFGAGEWNAGWTLLAFPVLLGYSETTAAELPGRKANRIAGTLLLFAVVMGLLAAGAELWSYVSVAAAVMSFAFHELLIGWGKRREQSRSPIFVHGARGLKVLDVQPGSPAAEMGIVRGETIVKANGAAVSTKEELHAALRTNSAFCKLEAINLDGQNKFAHRALFDGEHHQLGIVLCPDDNVVHYTEWRPMTILSLIGVKRKGRAPVAIARQEPVQEHGAGI